MKNIKYFKYWYTYEFEKFLKEYGYTLNDVKGFSVGYKKQYRGNILKIYAIHFKGNDMHAFSTILFKSLNEYHQTALGFNGNKLLNWYEDANIIKYKVKDIYGINDKYVITTK